MHIENYGEDVYITTPPDTNSSARIGISRGIGNGAIVVADRMGAIAFVELNADDTPIGLLTLQKDLRVIKSRQSIDTNGMFLHHTKVRAFVLDCADRSPDEPTTMTTYTQKITFGEMRDSGVRDVLVYCRDVGCSHSKTMSADLWPDNIRLSDVSRTSSALPVASASRNPTEVFARPRRRRLVPHHSGFIKPCLPSNPEQTAAQVIALALWFSELY